MAGRNAAGRYLVWCGIAASLLDAGRALAQDDGEGLATHLANPLAALISGPFQGNYNGGIGPEEDGEQYYVNIQPVVPITLNEDWNLISRTILFRVGERPMQIQGGVRYWAESPEDVGPTGWGARLAAIFLFPRR